MRNGISLPCVQTLQLSLAGRYEDYSDFSETLDPKVGPYWSGLISTPQMNLASGIQKSR